MVTNVRSIQTGRTKNRRTGQETLHILKWAGPVGSQGIALATILFGVAGPIGWGVFGIGLVWELGMFMVESNKSRKEGKNAVLDDLLLPTRSMFSVPESTAGKRPPLF